MAGEKISQLPAIVAPALTDLFATVQAGVTYKETGTQLLSLFNSNIQINESQVTGLTASLAGKLSLSGGTMTGAINMGTFGITNAANPTNPQDLATKFYVDQSSQGFIVINSCRVATTANLTATYSNGSSGVGATLTNAGTQAAIAIDGVTLSLNDRVLVKNQTTAADNGIFSATTLGSGATNWVLTRTTDYDTVAQINPGDLVLINAGTVNANTSWVETATVATIGTDPISFSRFTGQAASKGVSNNALPTVASVNGSTTTTNFASFSDVSGTVTDSGVDITDPTFNSIAFSPTTHGIVGTGTNDDAASGYVGEFFYNVVLSGSAIGLTTNTPANIASLNLPDGDFDVWGNINFTFSATGFSQYTTWISSTSATLPNSSFYTSYPVLSTAASAVGLIPPTQRFPLASPTTVYLSVTATFTGTANANGAIYARRRR